MARDKGGGQGKKQEQAIMNFLYWLKVCDNVSLRHAVGDGSIPTHDFIDTYLFVFSWLVFLNATFYILVCC